MSVYVCVYVHYYVSAAEMDEGVCVCVYFRINIYGGTGSEHQHLNIH